MYRSLSSIVPNAGDLLALEVGELAIVLLKHLKSYRYQPGNEVYQHGLISQQNFFNGLSPRGRQQPEYGDRQPAVNKALGEAWSWLEREGVLIRDAGQPAPWFSVSRYGEGLSMEEGGAYRNARLLPKDQLHPLIAAKVSPAFLRGEYDTAIFQAFREIEVAVRSAGGFSQNLVGDKLMRAAFAPAENGREAGPLADTELPAGEQHAMAHLFAGAFGVYRNSTGHRYVPTEPHEAAEVIMLASQLLRIVDRRRP